MKASILIIAAMGAWTLVSADLVAQDKGLPLSLMRASQVTGMDVRNPANERLGDIQDVVIEQETGAISYAVLSFGGFLGIGDKLFAVPFAALKPTTDRKAFTLDIPKDRLTKAPGFDKNTWPELNDHQWGLAIHTYYGVKPYWETFGGAVASDGGISLRGVLLRSSKVIGMGVRNPEKENLGDIKDIVLDQPAGVVAYAVISFGGFIGMGDKYFAVPWSALKLADDNKAFALNIPMDRLKKAPGFDKNTWPDLNNRQWGIDLHTYYAVTPYWEVRNGGVVTPAATGAVREVKIYTGKVKTFTKNDPAMLVIMTKSEDMHAELAPMSFLESHRLMFNPDDEVNIKAYETTRDGHKIFVVTEVTTNDKRIVTLRKDDASPVWTK
jgi:sporulation protein YlmC with PRC-barrel domain